MFHFFRRIRHNLIENIKIKKYLFYAIGEIVLVVIGILIALQINNWNEYRKIKVKELKILKELRSDLVQNINDVETNLRGFRSSINSNRIIKNHIENNLPCNDSLSYHFFNLSANVALTINQTTYDNLKQVGIEIISNDSVRFLISDLYGHKYPSTREFENRYMMEHFTNYIKPLMLSEFSSIGFNSLIPKNYTQLMNHPQLKQIIDFTIILYSYFIGNQTNFLKNKMEILIDEIDIEMEKLSR